MKNTLQLDFSNKASNVSIAAEKVSKIWGEGLGWTLQEAEEVLADHTQYLENLKSVGVQTSTILSRDIRKDHDGTFTIVEAEVYGGKDVSMALLSAPNVEDLVSAVTGDFRSIAELLLSIPPRDNEQYSSDHQWVSVPADLKPQNIVIDDDSRPVLIDTFAPKLWLNGKIKPLPTRRAGKGQILNDEIKIGDVRFLLGRLNGYFMALSTRWLIASHPEASTEDINTLRAHVSNSITNLTSKLLLGNPLFDQPYAQLLVSDSMEPELKLIELGTFEGPLYVQKLYEKEQPGVS